MNVKNKSKIGKKLAGITMAAIMLASIFAMISPASIAKDVPSGKEAIYYLIPDNSTASHCNTTTVDIRLNVTNQTGVSSGTFNITYTRCCANITSFTANTTFFAVFTGPDPAETPGRLTRNFVNIAGNLPKGVYHLGTFTVHCYNESYCVTDLTFQDARASNIPVPGELWELPVAVDNGTFTCEAPPHHDINITTDFAGAVDGIKLIKDGAAIPAGQNLRIAEEYQIRSRIVNDGDFNETVNVTIKVTNATDIAVFEPPMFQRTVNINGHKDAWRNWDTTGLAPGNYNITVNASIPLDDDWSNNERTREITLESLAAPTIINWYNNKTEDNSTEITINESECVCFNATADQPIDVWSWFVDNVNQSHNFDNFTYCDWTINGIYYVKVNATNANGTSNTVTWTVTVNDTTPPTVVPNSNAPTGTNVHVTTNISATFNEAINSSTLNNATIIVENSTGSTLMGLITYDPGTRIVTFDPVTDLEYNETYNVTITTGVEDLAGNNLSSDFSWNFTTETPPSTVVSIADIVASPNESIIVPIMVNNVVNLGSGTINVSYNSSVAHVTDVASGTGNALVVQAWNADNVNGLVRIVAWDSDCPHSGDVIFADVTYKSVGSPSNSTSLNITVRDLTDYYNFTQITHTVNNGSLSIIDVTPPILTNPSANPATILNDNGRPRPPNSNISRLNVTVTDIGSGVSNVTLNLSVIGGSAVQLMERIGGTDIWTVTTNATLGINLTNELVVTATDNASNSNTTVILLTVLLRGDVVRDGAITSGDALYIAKYLVGKEDAPDPLVSDVVPATGDGKITSGDALYIAKYLVGKEPQP